MQRFFFFLCLCVLSYSSSALRKHAVEPSYFTSVYSLVGDRVVQMSCPLDACMTPSRFLKSFCGFKFFLFRLMTRWDLLDIPPGDVSPSAGVKLRSFVVGAQPESSALFSDPPFVVSSAVPLSDSSSIGQRVSADEHRELTLLCSMHSAHANGKGSTPS